MGKKIKKKKKKKLCVGEKQFFPQLIQQHYFI